MKIKRKTIIKKSDKLLFQKDVTKVVLPCIFFMFFSLILAYVFKFLGFDTSQKEFFGTMYLLYCLLSIGIIGFIDKDFILDKKIEREKCSPINFISGFSVMITTMVLFTIPTILLNLCLQPLGFTLENIAPANTTSDSITHFLYVAILGPICEEIIFRGFVQRKLEKYSPVIAIVTSAVCFGLFHGNFGQIFPMIGVGLVLGYMAYKYSIKTSIALHITHNLCLGELFGVLTDFLEKNGEEYLLPIINITPFVATMMTLSIIGIIVLVKLFLQNKLPFSDYCIKFKKLLYPFTSTGMIIFLTISICTSIELLKPL